MMTDRWLSNRSFVIGFILVSLLGAMALISLVYTPADPLAMDIPSRLQAPGQEHLLGTDQYGRDTLSRIMKGAQTTVAVGVLSVSIGLTLGLLVGSISGFYRGWADDVLMRLMDGLYAFPAILFAIMVVAVMGPGLWNTALAIGVVSVPVFARLVRAAFLSLREREFVEAAGAAGASDFRIIWRHLLPNALGPIIVQSSVSFATAVLSEAALSYLGLGTQPPEPSWGRMLEEAQSFMTITPWPAIIPGVFIGLTVLGFNLLGDGLRDILDPRSANSGLGGRRVAADPDTARSIGRESGVSSARAERVSAHGPGA